MHLRSVLGIFRKPRAFIFYSVWITWVHTKFVIMVCLIGRFQPLIDINISFFLWHPGLISASAWNEIEKHKICFYADILPWDKEHNFMLSSSPRYWMETRRISYSKIHISESHYYASGSMGDRTTTKQVSLFNRLDLWPFEMVCMIDCRKSF